MYNMYIMYNMCNYLYDKTDRHHIDIKKNNIKK